MSNRAVPDLERMFNPRAIALVGASKRASAYGHQVLRQLLAYECPVPIYPVNPKETEILGLPCYGDLAAVPKPVDLVYLALPAAAGPDIMEQAAGAGVGAVAIPGSGYADGGPEGIELQRAITQIAQSHGIAICGPNNLGFANYPGRIVPWTSPIPKFDPTGRTALISQSGSAGMVFTQDDRNLGISYMVTTGNEAVVTASDYLDYFARIDQIDVIVCYLETLRDPTGFARAARTAYEAGKRIAAIKVGRSETAQRTVAAHTGGIAGDDSVYDAFFRQCGVLRADDMDELVEAGLLLAAYRDPPKAGRVAVVTMSGGEAALAADLFADAGVALSELKPQTVAELQKSFPDFQTPRNPVDAYGFGWNEAYFRKIVEAVAADENVDVVVFCLDFFEPGVGPSSDGMAPAIAEVARLADKPFVVINNTSGPGFRPEKEAILKQAGVPCLLGMRAGISAVVKWLQLDAAAPAPRTSPGDDARLRERVAAARHEHERLELLQQVGVPMAATKVVSTAGEALAAAEEFGQQVVLKGTAPQLLHKSELGLVVTGLSQADEIEAAYRSVAGRLEKAGAADSTILVQEMCGEGVELILGARYVEGFGTSIVVGVGGTLVEVVGRAAVRLAPVDRATALSMLDETPAGTLIEGVRGRGPFDLQAAAEAIVAFAEFAHAAGDVVNAVEINPLIVLAQGQGVVGVDAVFEH